MRHIVPTNFLCHFEPSSDIARSLRLHTSGSLRAKVASGIGPREGSPGRKKKCWTLSSSGTSQNFGHSDDGFLLLTALILLFSSLDTNPVSYFHLHEFHQPLQAEWWHFPVPVRQIFHQAEITTLACLSCAFATCAKAAVLN